jgi:hypothetical protein
MRKDSFKLHQSTKRVACTFTDPTQRREYIHMMIEAQRAAERFANSRFRDKSAADKEPAAE